MIKRVTLLRKRADLTEAAFRTHWAKPHATIALGFGGLSKYTQNRIDRVVWRFGPDRFQIDGVVELWFDSAAAVAAAAQSPVTDRLIRDEPRFLSGLTGLFVGESWAAQSDAPFKYMVIGWAAEPAAVLSQVCPLLKQHCLDGTVQEFSCDLLTAGFVRKSLWHEPVAPNFLVTLWYNRLDAARRSAFGRDAPLRRLLARTALSVLSIRVNELRIV